MVQAFYFLGCIVLLFGSVIIGFKVIELYQKYRAGKYQTNQHHFLSDLYDLQRKWSVAGEVGYSESLGNLIRFHGNVEKESKPGGVGLPLTSDAASTLAQLAKLKKDALKEAIDEIETEFNG